jgi:hypothetical protein
VEAEPMRIGLSRSDEENYCIWMKNARKGKFIILTMRLMLIEVLLGKKRFLVPIGDYSLSFAYE